MNELSNHDHSRFMTRTNHKVGRTASVGPQAADEGIDKALFRLGVMIQMTWPGAPTIYYEMCIRDSLMTLHSSTLCFGRSKSSMVILIFAPLFSLK